MKRRVLSVGNCSADTWSLRRLFAEKFQAELVSLDDWEEVRALLEAPARSDKEAADEPSSASLVIVNRILDATGSPGVDLIRQLKAHPRGQALRVMLVSNYAEAQRDAVAAGALPGFGKSELSERAVLDRLGEILSQDDPEPA